VVLEWKVAQRGGGFLGLLDGLHEAEGGGEVDTLENFLERLLMRDSRSIRVAVEKDALLELASDSSDDKLASRPGAASWPGRRHRRGREVVEEEKGREVVESLLLNGDVPFAALALVVGPDSLPLPPRGPLSRSSAPVLVPWFPPTPSRPHIHNRG